MADQEIDREPELLSRERRKAATLVEGALDRADIYKNVEKAVDALASKHLDTIMAKVRDIRRQEAGDEVVAQEERSGNKTDAEYERHVKSKREEREKAHQEALRKQKEIDDERERVREEEARARRKEREERRRAEDERIREERRLQDEQREREWQERYERRRREDRDWGDRDHNDSRTRDRDRYHDRSPAYRSDRGLSPRYRDSKIDKSSTPKDPTPAPSAPPVDEKDLEAAALKLLLKEGEELAAKARQKPEFDFEEAEAIESGRKPAKPAAESKAESPPREPERRRRGSSYDRSDRNRSYRRDDSREYRRSSFRNDGDRRRDWTEGSYRPRDRDSDDKLAIRDFRRERSGDRSFRPRRSESRSDTRGYDRDHNRDRNRDRDRDRDKSAEHGKDKAEDHRSGERDRVYDYRNRDRDRARDRDRDRASGSGRARERDRDRDREPVRDLDRNDYLRRRSHYSRSRSRSRLRDRDRDRDRDRERDHRHRDRDRDRDHHREREGSAPRAPAGPEKEARSCRRSLDVLDIDRYVPPGSNRSRSPRRRVRSPEREDRPRKVESKIDRYVPGGERDREREREKENEGGKTKESEDRKHQKE